MTLREELEREEERRLAPYAARSSAYGRRQSIEEHPWRTRFQRDRDRIIHAKAFRRLEAKAHHYVPGGGDHIRTQLTHTLEVAQIARTMARALRANEDLAEAVALAHDLGRGPFGTAFEASLAEQLRQLGLPPFAHEVQGLRVVDSLEERYARYRGLNLTSAVREGIVRHHAPRAQKPEAGAADTAGPRRSGWPPEFAPADRPPATVEGQLVALADYLATVEQALDDALRLGVYTYSEFTRTELFASLDRFFLDERRLSIASHLDVEAGQNDEARRGVVVRCLVDYLVSNAITTSDALLAGSDLKAGEITAWCVGIGPSVEQHATALMDALALRRTKDRRAVLAAEHAATLARELFRAFWNDPTLLPSAFAAEAVAAQDAAGRATPIVDYLSGMTDGYAEEELRLCIMTPPNVRVRCQRRQRERERSDLR